MAQTASPVRKSLLDARQWIANQDRVVASNIRAFADSVADTYSIELATYRQLHQWSIAEPAIFWQRLAEHVRLEWDSPPSEVMAFQPGKMRGTTWFDGGTLNYARNLLLGCDDDIVVVESGEQLLPREVSRGDLKKKVFAIAQKLRSWGVGPGDVVCGVITNSLPAIVGVLATSSLGAVWSSCSPDFGLQALMDRLTQVRPKVLIANGEYVYSGKVFSCVEKIGECIQHLEGLAGVIGVDDGCPVFPSDGEKSWEYSSFVEAVEDKDAQEFFQSVPFDAPLFIMFTSGTTGPPKCIVHTVGGTLLQHKKELALHADLKPGDRLLYFTTCGWMMWNWSLSSLAVGATLVTYDGSPAFPSLGRFWEVAAETGATHVGTSPKFIQSCLNRHLTAARGGVHTVITSGSPLLPEHFDWIYQALGSEVFIASISGGTDLISCFVLGNLLDPVVRGEIQGPGLGMAVAVFDDDHRPVLEQQGELVCTKPFVSMPLRFLDDPHDERYRLAYFRDTSIGEVWFHGDVAEEKRSGGFIIYGRSDATLNPGGVRIGTAELYRVVEQIPGIADSLVVGLPADRGDESIVLFVQLDAPDLWSDGLRQEIVSAIKSKLSPRHAPKRVHAVGKIPYTRSGKKMELIVKKFLLGKDIEAGLGAMADPTSLDEYREFMVDER